MDTIIQEQRVYLVLHMVSGATDIERVEVGETLRSVILYHLYPDTRYGHMPRVSFITFTHESRRYGVKRAPGRQYEIVELPPEEVLDEGPVEI